MKKEYTIAFSIGLIILAYVLDALVNPLDLTLSLPTPYHYLTQETITTYVFTFTSIFLKALAISLSIPTILSALDLKALTKGISLLIISGLLQLYALQDVATKANVVPLEWSIAFTLAGLMLLVPSALLILIGFFTSLKKDTPPAPKP
jgi:hypothetical protein